MRTAIRFGLVTFTLSGAFAQTKPSAPDMVRRVIDAYEQASSFSFSATSTRRSITGQQVTEESVLKFKLAEKSPDKVRMETDAESAAMFGLGLKTEVIGVISGRNSSLYFPQLNQYAAQNSEDGSVLFDSLRKQLLPPHDVKLKIGSAKFLREAALPTDSGSSACYVIEIPEDVKPGFDPQTYTWWVEKSSSKLLREDRKRVFQRGSDESVTLYQNVKLNEPLAEDVFLFTPPPGSRKVDRPEP